MKNNAITPVLAGHPFAPTGRGEDIRSSFRALRSARLNVKVRDIYGFNNREDQEIEHEIAQNLVNDLSSNINIFYINGDEVTQTLEHIKNQIPSSAYNVICPAWELGIYPDKWARQLERFDEIWTLSKFSDDSIRKAVSKPVFYMPLASQTEILFMMRRKDFGIPESAYTFLFFFDFTSYIDRKNPFAVLKAFEKLCMKAPNADVCLVIKLNGWEHRTQDYQHFKTMISDFEFMDRLHIIDKTLSNNEIKNLVRCSDCFISLHRSEGFGRGMAEAMYLGKPVIGTGYSGNMDFMNEENSCLVNFKLVPVEDGQYPYGEGQVWAEPDIDHAMWYMYRLLMDYDYGRILGAIGSRHIRQFFSYRAIGLRYQNRIESILNEPKQTVIFPNVP